MTLIFGKNVHKEDKKNLKKPKAAPPAIETVFLRKPISFEEGQDQEEKLVEGEKRENRLENTRPAISHTRIVWSSEAERTRSTPYIH